MKSTLTTMAWLALALPPAHALAGPPPMRTVIVHLRPQLELAKVGGAGRAARLKNVIGALKSHAQSSQRSVDGLLRAKLAEGSASRVTSYWIFNGLAVTATPEVIEALSRHPEVASITPDEISVVPAAIPAGPAEPNLTSVKVPQLWGLGLLGRDVVIASLDTGVDASHPDLSSRWRGGSNSWFDPYGQHLAPIDLAGHGTWTMGVMVGGDAGGTSIGVAPDARWIAARIFNDQGTATASAIHLAFQWLLDPDGDPATDDAPDVVNNSWAFGTPGCNPEFQADLQALRAAGMVTVFAAGNNGPGTLTSTSPANYPNVFSVGNVDNTGALAADSSRGPSACDGSIYPDVVAPGIGIVTSDLFSSYWTVSGTSISAPHVSGILALLRQAFPTAGVAALEAALTGTALDLGAPGADNDFGHGRVDAKLAHDLLANQAPPPPPQPPTALPDGFSVAEDTAATFSGPGVLANDSSPTGSPLTAVLLGTTAHGVLTLQPNGGFSYTPSPNFNGTDLFTYAASDGTRSSSPATVTLAVAAVNDAPVATDDRVRVSRRSPTTLNLLGNDFDPDGALAPATITIIAPPTKGTVTVSATGAVVYQPGRFFFGVDSFTYRVADNAGSLSNLATVRVERK